MACHGQHWRPFRACAMILPRLECSAHGQQQGGRPSCPLSLGQPASLSVSHALSAELSRSRGCS
eukprot:2854976-Rhodomonas_salina.1